MQTAVRAFPNKKVQFHAPDIVEAKDSLVGSDYVLEDRIGFSSGLRGQTAQVRNPYDANDITHTNPVTRRVDWLVLG